LAALTAAATARGGNGFTAKVAGLGWVNSLHGALTVETPAFSKLSTAGAGGREEDIHSAPQQAVELQAKQAEGRHGAIRR